MPETLEPHLEEVSEAALVERVMMRKVKAAVDMYDQLLQSGKKSSLTAAFTVPDCNQSIFNRDIYIGSQVT